MVGARLAAAAFALLPLVQAIIRPSATFLGEEGLRIWLPAKAFPFSAIGYGSEGFAQDDGTGDVGDSRHALG